MLKWAPRHDADLRPRHLPGRYERCHNPLMLVSCCRTHPNWALLTILNRYSMCCCIAFDTCRTHPHEWFVLYSAIRKWCFGPQSAEDSPTAPRNSAQERKMAHSNKPARGALGNNAPA